MSKCISDRRCTTRLLRLWCRNSVHKIFSTRLESFSRTSTVSRELAVAVSRLSPRSKLEMLVSPSEFALRLKSESKRCAPVRVSLTGCLFFSHLFLVSMAFTMASFALLDEHDDRLIFFFDDVAASKTVLERLPDCGSTSVSLLEVVPSSYS
jgi:hypothetical protein